MKHFKGTALATAVATMLVISGCGSDDEAEKQGNTTQGVKCQGANECKGLGECQAPGGSHTCQGLNECKGLGWIEVDSPEACAEKGGTVLS
jgi:hypothetical protein